MNDLLKQWAALDIEHKRFVLRVHESNGCKHGAEPSSIDSDQRLDPPNEGFFKRISLWRKGEESGFIECNGSYKWRTTAKFSELLCKLLDV